MNNSGCPFRISITPKTWPATATRSETAGWKIADLLPDHSHAAPYEPLDLEAENARRAKPLPISYTPPRVPVTTTRSPSPPPSPVSSAPAVATTPSALVPSPPSESDFATFLRSIDPTLLQYIANFEPAGFPEAKLADLLLLDDTEIEGLMEDVHLPSLVRAQFTLGFRSARERSRQGEAGLGSLWTPGKQAQALAWIEAMFVVPQP